MLAIVVVAVCERSIILVKPDISQMSVCAVLMPLTSGNLTVEAGVRAARWS